MTPGSQPDDPQDQDDARDEDQDRPGHLTARPTGILIALALGLLFIGWVLYRLIDAQRI